MIIEIRGNIVDSNADILVNPVNCVGVMGSGVAKVLKEKYPEHYVYYRKHCWNWKGGECHLYGKILMVTTKEHWRNPSKIEWIRSIVREIAVSDWDNLAMPIIGGSSLDKGVVVDLIYRHLGHKRIVLYRY